MKRIIITMLTLLTAGIISANSAGTSCTKTVCSHFICRSDSSKSLLKDVAGIITKDKPAADSIGAFSTISQATFKTSRISVADQVKEDIVLMTAYNFQFGDTKIQDKYVGHLNIFQPGIHKRFGFITGIMSIDYAAAGDPNNTPSAYFMENVQIHPLDQMVTGSKYLQRFDQYSTQTKFSTWSFYVQPLFELTKATSKSKIYLTLHGELLASKYEVTSTRKNIQVDTMIYNTSSPVSVLRIIDSSTFSSKKFLSGYFGIGATFDLYFGDKGRFFFQPVFGCNTSSVSFENKGENIGANPASRLNIKNKFIGFYLVRASYQHLISDKSSLIVGVDIRGNLPIYSPNYAAYVGLNVGIDKLIDVFK